MIKRRFFKLDHGDREASDPSSSSSDSELEAVAETSEEESEEDAIAEVKPNDDEAGSNSSGYASEDSSANDVDVNSAGLLFSEDDAGAINERQMLINRELLSKVFKCRLCPRIICLSEETLRDHLQSKRHARSEKLLSEGRLKAILNSDGEIENQEISEIQTKDSEDDAEKNHKGKKQHKKRLRKKKRDKASARKMLSTKEPGKRRKK
ncbi:hypothetical protein GLYMA_02G090200v4 [Glycine max]|uniref:histone-lysine N-methyltransferase SETD1B isoform X2 n=1 Tax=Glycine max TaxID=3847 RepID=UPI0003DE77DA|nr:histone-lysine N-methyltransferase SETD1B isoform X2 [Glycine max]KAG4401931.1 hypothetical protein GLYMA_02G090200v4 [Glycine max]KAH1059468.1 hypothetical protein GYH30_003467 [Glycine max]|eukprot:XP_006574845.1 histone-lysine N-methyltransferase SETD1B isoform X2 [Glycine max]